MGILDSTSERSRKRKPTSGHQERQAKVVTLDQRKDAVVVGRTEIMRFRHHDAENRTTTRHRSTRIINGAVASSTFLKRLKNAKRESNGTEAIPQVSLKILTRHLFTSCFD